MKRAISQELNFIRKGGGGGGGEESPKKTLEEEVGVRALSLSMLLFTTRALNNENDIRNFIENPHLKKVLEACQKSQEQQSQSVTIPKMEFILEKGLDLNITRLIQLSKNFIDSGEDPITIGIDIPQSTSQNPKYLDINIFSATDPNRALLFNRYPIHSLFESATSADEMLTSVIFDLIARVGEDRALAVVFGAGLSVVSLLTSEESRKVLEKRHPTTLFYIDSSQALTIWVREIFVGPTSSSTAFMKASAALSTTSSGMETTPFKNLADFFKGCQQAIIFFKSCTRFMAVLEERQKAESLPPFVDPNEVKVAPDWWEFFNALNLSAPLLKDLVTNQDTFLALLLPTMHVAALKFRTFLLHTSFALILQKCMAILSCLGSENYTYLSEAYHTFESIKLKLRAVEAHVLTQNEYDYLLKSSRNIWTYISSPAYGLAWILDPRHVSTTPSLYKTGLEERLCTFYGEGKEVYKEYTQFTIHVLQERERGGFRYKMLVEGARNVQEFWAIDGSQWPRLQRIALRLFRARIGARLEGGDEETGFREDVGNKVAYIRANWRAFLGKEEEEEEFEEVVIPKRPGRLVLYEIEADDVIAELPSQPLAEVQGPRLADLGKRGKGREKSSPASGSVQEEVDMELDEPSPTIVHHIVVPSPAPSVIHASPAPAASGIGEKRSLDALDGAPNKKAKPATLSGGPDTLSSVLPAPTPSEVPLWMGDMKYHLSIGIDLHYRMVAQWPSLHPYPIGSQKIKYSDWPAHFEFKEADIFTDENNLIFKLLTEGQYDGVVFNNADDLSVQEIEHTKLLRAILSKKNTTENASLLPFPFGEGGLMFCFYMPKPETLIVSTAWIPDKEEFLKLLMRLKSGHMKQNTEKQKEVSQLPKLDLDSRLEPRSTSAFKDPGPYRDSSTNRIPPMPKQDLDSRLEPRSTSAFKDPGPYRDGDSSNNRTPPMPKQDLDSRLEPRNSSAYKDPGPYRDSDSSANRIPPMPKQDLDSRLEPRSTGAFYRDSSTNHIPPMPKQDLESRLESRNTSAFKEFGYNRDGESSSSRIPPMPKQDLDKRLEPRFKGLTPYRDGESSRNDGDRDAYISREGKRSIPSPPRRRSPPPLPISYRLGTEPVDMSRYCRICLNRGQSAIFSEQHLQLVHKGNGRGNSSPVDSGRRGSSRNEDGEWSKSSRPSSAPSRAHVPAKSSASAVPSKTLQSSSSNLPPSSSSTSEVLSKASVVSSSSNMPSSTPAPSVGPPSSTLANVPPLPNSSMYSASVSTGESSKASGSAGDPSIGKKQSPPRRNEKGRPPSPTKQTAISQQQAKYCRHCQMEGKGSVLFSLEHHTSNHKNSLVSITSAPIVPPTTSSKTISQEHILSKYRKILLDP